jgi:hypothetical protein
MIEVTCVGCGLTVKCPDEYAGKKARCKKCGASILVPSAAPAASDAEWAKDFIAEPSSAPPAQPELEPNEEWVPASLSRATAATIKPVTKPAASDLSRVIVERDNSRRPRGVSWFQGVVIIGLLLIGLGFPCFGFLRPVFTQQWEYKIASPSDIGFQREMDDLGAQGWEMVFARRATSQTDSVHYEVILKRPKRW